MTIAPITAPVVSTAGLPVPIAAPAGDGAFGRVLSAAISGVESLRQSADVQVERFLGGDGGELHTAILATQRADLALQLFLQVRNKVVQAYQEVMRMQL